MIVGSAEGAKYVLTAEHQPGGFAAPFISRFQRSIGSTWSYLGRWPRLLHFAPSALKSGVLKNLALNCGADEKFKGGTPAKTTMLRVGLTGSIAVGKSFVLGVLAELGCRVLDADQTARQAVAPGSPGLSAVVAEFGKDILQTDGTLDRARLGALVFADGEKRLRLNAILHPFIIAAQDEQLRLWEQEDAGGIAVVDAALMIESGGYRRFDKLIVVHCRPDIQLERLLARDSLSPAEAKQRIAAQMSQEEKKRHADYLIDTSEGFDAARLQTEAVYGKLSRLR